MVVPGRAHAFRLRPGLDLLVAFEGRGHKASYQRQILGSILGAHPAVILPEGYVQPPVQQPPVQSVFDRPMLAGSAQHLIGVGLQAGNEVAALRFGLFPNGTGLLTGKSLAAKLDALFL